MTRNTGKQGIEIELQKARKSEEGRLNEEKSVRLLANEMQSVLSNKKLFEYLNEDVLLVFELSYDSKDKVPKDNMYDFRHRANMYFAWTLGLHGSVRDNDYPEVCHELENDSMLRRLYGPSFFTKPNLVFRSEQGFKASCADGLGDETKYITAEGARNLDSYVLPTIKELALGKNEFREKINLRVPFGGERWIDYDNNVGNENWLEINGPITPQIFRDIMRYITKDKIRL